MGLDHLDTVNGRIEGERNDLKHQPVLVGPTTPEQIEENVKAVDVTSAQLRSL